MTSREFDLWAEFMRVEVISEGSDLERWAYLMTALANGPLRKKSKAMFSVADFMPRRWAPAPAKRKPTTGAQAMAFVASLKSKLKKG